MIVRKAIFFIIITDVITTLEGGGLVAILKL